MADKEQGTDKKEKTEFPVDNRPLIGSFLLLFLVFIGLCATVYFQNSSESFGLGNILLMLAFGFAAYVQRGDSYRVGAILIGGAIICTFVYIFGGGSDEPVSNPVPKGRKPTVQSPEGLGSSNL